MNLTALKELLRQKSPEFHDALETATRETDALDQLLFLSALRRRAQAQGFPDTRPGRGSLRLALVGGFTLHPLHEVLTHLLESAGVSCSTFVGEYDNYTSEILDADGPLYRLRPEVVFILPGHQRCSYLGAITDPRSAVQASVDQVVEQYLLLCSTVHERTRADVILCNFMLPAGRDLGAYRTRALGSDWSFRKCVNLELGLRAPSFVQICDQEFLAARNGGAQAHDARSWFESKQPCSANQLVVLCREAAQLIRARHTPPKKVLVLDLDNTLWGGVVADDGIDGIEIGDTSPRGEAFKSFQRYIATLKSRGVLLAVCSKNEHDRALEPFERHPEMVLKADDFVSFKANWEPKSDNIQRIASELGLGVDSFVFVDDNPAEIDIVRQFVPQVTTILLGNDPSLYVEQLMESRLFEPRSITEEDSARTDQYRAETERQGLLGAAADMGSYLKSLRMVGTIRDFDPVDVPRLAQLINKSNQFNLTTRRRTEAEVSGLRANPEFECFSVRLADRFGDHGLISIAIARAIGETMEIDTWLMSCRVLKREVEWVVLNELCRRARKRGCSRLVGVYRPTAKNGMVSELYPTLGFRPETHSADQSEYSLDISDFQEHPTNICLSDQS